MSDPLEAFTVADGHCLEHGHYAQGPITRRYGGDVVMLPRSEGQRLQRAGVLVDPKRKTISGHNGRSRLVFVDEDNDGKWYSGPPRRRRVIASSFHPRGSIEI